MSILINVLKTIVLNGYRAMIRMEYYYNNIIITVFLSRDNNTSMYVNCLGSSISSIYSLFRILYYYYHTNRPKAIIIIIQLCRIKDNPRDLWDFDSSEY